jgi:NADH-quinone oxidoreductase subunit E
MLLTTEDRSKLDGILERNGRNPEMLIQMLQDVQAEFTYLPEDHLRYVSDELRVPVTRVYHVATFYKAFSLEPRGRHIVTVCRGTACHVRGSQRLVETVERELGIRDGETTDDMAFTLECVNCLGACALAPVVVIDEVYYEKVTPDRLRKILDNYRNGHEPEQAPADEAPAPAEAPPAPAEPPPAEAPPEPPTPAGPSKRALKRQERKGKRKAKKSKGRKAAEPPAKVAPAAPAAAKKSRKKKRT